MDYSVAICDDEALDREYLAALVERWGAKATTFPSAEAFLFQYAEDKRFDILLLDVEMGGMDGVTLAKRLRAENDALQIVFVTGYSEYLAEGYEVEALHYLIKPVDEQKLVSVLERAAEKLRRTEPALLLPVDGELVRVLPREIVYVEALGHTLMVHSAKGVYETKLTLKQFERELPDGFVRCHRAYVANLRYVRRLSRAELALDGGETLPLSRRLYEDVSRAMLRHVKGGA